MLGDIQILSEGAFGYPGDAPFTVLAGATAILAGEPVSKALGAASVTALATNTPVVSTDFMCGIASTNSTQTASADGTVRVTKLVPGTVYIMTPKVAATWDTQAKYDALVGDRVLFDLTAGTYTILATDGATNGLVVEPLDIKIHPGKVAFSIRAAVSYNA